LHWERSSAFCQVLAFAKFEMMWIACSYMFITWICQSVDEGTTLKIWDGRIVEVDVVDVYLYLAYLDGVTTYQSNMNASMEPEKSSCETNLVSLVIESFALALPFQSASFWRSNQLEFFTALTVIPVFGWDLFALDGTSSKTASPET
jgi:hypothetical protein